MLPVGLKFLILIMLTISLVYSSPSDTLSYRRPYQAHINSAYLDVESGAQRAISSDHSHIHNYEAYSYNQIDTLADNESSVIAIYIPDNVEFHLKSVEVWMEDSPGLLCVYVHPDSMDLSSDTAIAYNRNQSDNAKNILFSSNVLITDSLDFVSNPVCLDPRYFGSGSGVGQTVLSGSVPSDLEWIFSGTYIYIELENLSGGSSLSSMCIFWYEPEE